MIQEQIQKLFKQGYNRNDWTIFLGQTFANTQLYREPQILTGINTNVASEAYKLGYLNINDDGIERQIGVFEVSLSQGIILERNRVGLRNLLRSHWVDLDGAFIVYHHPNSTIKKWRFTYVSELTGYDVEGEFTKIVTEPKRYTYVLGQGETVRTATERFTQLAAKGSNATIDDVKEAFSVEKLSKTFFDEYKKHYQIFNDYILSSPQARGCFSDYTADKEKDIRDFTKKMLGRIIFLYFIQKKGWLGVPVDGDWGEGDFNFMSRLFETHDIPETFYNDKLVKLFFETLNKERPNDEIELIEGEKCRVPYLNGGLFEAEDPNRQRIVFDGELFKNLFEFFNQYNFTIYEDDPNDHTVAVDPEMLGHIFENLLEDNKDKGAFYTPKDIVHYMCQESLIEYLTTWFEDKGYEVTSYATMGNEREPGLFSSVETSKQLTIETATNEKRIDRLLIEKLLKKQLDDNSRDTVMQHNKEFHKALDTVKVCDPAIGSGAFPMGLLQEIFTTKETLWNFEHGNLIDFPASEVKLNIIQNSIYGVDIEKGAVDIARLRFWLSLVVDEETPKALPNLDYKIVTGNSLVSKLNDTIINIEWSLKNSAHGLFETDLEDEKKELLKLIDDKQKDFFDPHSNKKSLALEVRNLKIDLLINQLALMIQTSGQTDTPAKSNFPNQKKYLEAFELHIQAMSWKDSINKLRKLKENPDQRLNFFDWKLDFPEVLNEAINPNPGFDIVIGNPPYIQLQKNGGHLSKELGGQRFETFERTGDIYSLFYEKGWQLLIKKGLLCYITSNKWMRSGYGKSTRKFFAENTNPLILIDFAGQKIFESATVDTNILMFSKDKNRQQTTACTVKEKVQNNLSVYVKQQANTCDFSNDESWVVLSEIEQRIKNKIEAVGTPLKDWNINIYRGILTGYNEAFIIDGKKKDELIAEDPKSAEIIRPLLRGRDIKRYSYEFADLYLLFIPWHFPLQNNPNITGNSLEAEKAFENQYPAIYNHLLKYKNELSNRNKAETGIRYEWYALQRWGANYWEDFYKQKIVYNDIAQKLTFAIANEGMFFNNTVYFINSNNEDLVYLTVFLNSPIIDWYYKTLSVQLGEKAVRLFSIYVENIPIIQSTLTNPFVKNIQTIIENKSFKLGMNENELNKLIYSAYQLTTEEIEFIENQ